MGHGLLHQSNTSGRIGAVLARSKDSHGLGEKVGVGAITLRGDARRDQADLLYLEVRRGTQVAQGRGLQNLHSWVRIPPAPPSLPFQINGLQLSVLSPNPQLGNIWERLRKGPLPASRLRACVCLESHACTSSAWSQWSRVPIAAARSWRVRRYRAGRERACGEVDATSRAQALPPLTPASAHVLKDYFRGAVRPTGSGRVSLPHSGWRRTSCDALPAIRVSVD